MTDRLRRIFDCLIPCHTFADIGCDHGYIAKAMIDSGKCKRVIISDISKKCLSKAETLLYPYINNGSCESVVSDGFDKITFCDEALISGMGGEEIVSIIERADFLPDNLILQPMKNCDKVRITAVNKGYKFISDKMFCSGGKYYNLMVLTKGKDNLTDEEIEFGRDNIKGDNPEFKSYVASRIKKLKKIASNEQLDASQSNIVNEKIKKLERYV